MHVIKANLNRPQSECRIGVVVSLFNRSITGRLQDACVDYLLEHGVSKENITLIEVPGAVELPVVSQTLLTKDRVDIVIVLGAVIRGDTDHYDYVCQQVSYGCQKVALLSGKPVIFGILTTDDEEQALARVGGHCGHKGIDAAEAALMMLDIMKQI